jgi:HNH endonuclease/AP2 domain
MKELILTKGGIAAVSDEDYDRLKDYRWRFDGQYVVRSYHVGPGKRDYRTQSLHREVMNAKKGQIIDHINHSTRDNTRDNLRFCTTAQNSRNAKTPSTNTSGYRGVHFHCAGRYRWTAAIRLDGKKYRIGAFSTKEQAALAYNLAAIALHGEFATLNVIRL